MRFLQASVLAALGMSVVTATEQANDYGVLNWINNTYGGYIHPDQEFRMDPETGISGMFATKLIKKGDLLMQVPWSIIIESDYPDEEGQMCCGTVKAVAREMKRGNESLFAPYANYLNAQPDNSIPSAWSDLGKKLLHDLVGHPPEDPKIPPVEPTEWLDYDWYIRCRGPRTDVVSAKAAVMVLQRSDDATMIPGYDMYNHRNGKYLNTECATFPKNKHVTRASRDIEAGEQIHNSYNMCKECGGRDEGYGTAEILRDYGFIEPMPQRWHFLDDAIQFDIDMTPDGLFTVQWSDDMKPRQDNRDSVINYFKQQIRRLRQVKNVDYKDGNPGIPQNEWDTAWEFQRSYIQAMTLGIQAVEALKTGTKPATYNITEALIGEQSHYDPLDWESDDLDYVEPTCDNKEIMKFHDHYVVEELKTHFQDLNFAIRPDDGDIMMDLDNIVQISSNYRPQYHEYVTHAAARYVESIKRVIFIGGGDSMLLHEVLKYPDLELVVGLELDQIVMRKCFKWFLTQTHFDDPRVEWWIGDATKSLLLLSQEYWQSFDLVLVDLSETVMSLSVTKELDVFDALGLLLKHDGVMVKNELYMEPFSKVFDYTQAIYYESPVICSQVLAFGSNKVDFMQDEVYDHGIETFLYKNMHDPDTRYDFLHDYRMNDARKQGKCGKLPVMEELKEQSKSAGIVHIVEAEKTSAQLDAGLGAILVSLIEKVGFSPLASPVYENGTLVIVMTEGYIVAHMFPEQKYCAFDVNLWGSFHKLKELSETLTNAVGSELVSQYRIVVGGMYGSSTWEEDRKIIGPQIVQTRKCDVEEYNEAPEMSTELITTAVEESMELVVGDEITTVVVCADDNNCLAADILNKYAAESGRTRKIVRLDACPSMTSESIESQYDCEIQKSLELKKALGNDKADLFIVDGEVSLPMFQILNSMLSRDAFRESIIAEANIFMAWSLNPEADEYQRNFLDRYRKQYTTDPMGRVEFWLRAGKKAVEFGIVSAGYENVNYNIPALDKRLKEAFKDNENVAVELRGIYGGLFEFKEEFIPKEFLQTDYDEKPGLKQYYAQQPLAHHTIFQLEEAEGKTYIFEREAINRALQQSLDYTEFECTTRYSFPGVGEGALMLCINAGKGSVLLTWDGRKHIDINYFLYGKGGEIPGKFIGAFLHYTENTLNVALRDNMPRGTGRVMNFPEDMMTPEERKNFFDNLGKSDEEDADVYPNVYNPIEDEL